MPHGVTVNTSTLELTFTTHQHQTGNRNFDICCGTHGYIWLTADTSAPPESQLTKRAFAKMDTWRHLKPSVEFKSIAVGHIFILTGLSYTDRKANTCSSNDCSANVNVCCTMMMMTSDKILKRYSPTRLERSMRNSVRCWCQHKPVTAGGGLPVRNKASG